MGRGPGAEGGEMAGLTGLEPATSCVTGRRSNQLNYNPAAAAPGAAKARFSKPRQNTAPRRALSIGAPYRGAPISTLG